MRRFEKAYVARGLGLAVAETNVVKDLKNGQRRADRVLTIDGQALLACPDCWPKEEIAKEYPLLAGMPISNRLCNTHFQKRLTEAMETAEWSRQPSGTSAKSTEREFPLGHY